MTSGNKSIVVTTSYPIETSEGGHEWLLVVCTLSVSELVSISSVATFHSDHLLTGLRTCSRLSVVDVAMNY